MIIGIVASSGVQSVPSLPPLPPGPPTGPDYVNDIVAFGLISDGLSYNQVGDAYSPALPTLPAKFSHTRRNVPRTDPTFGSVSGQSGELWAHPGDTWSIQFYHIQTGPSSGDPILLQLETFNNNDYNTRIRLTVEQPAIGSGVEGFVVKYEEKYEGEVFFSGSRSITFNSSGIYSGTYRHIQISRGSFGPSVAFRVNNVVQLPYIFTGNWVLPKPSGYSNYSWSSNMDVYSGTSRISDLVITRLVDGPVIPSDYLANRSVFYWPTWPLALMKLNLGTYGIYSFDNYEGYTPVNDSSKMQGSSPEGRVRVGVGPAKPSGAGGLVLSLPYPVGVVPGNGINNVSVLGDSFSTVSSSPNRFKQYVTILFQFYVEKTSGLQTSTTLYGLWDYVGNYPIISVLSDASGVGTCEDGQFYLDAWNQCCIIFEPGTGEVQVAINSIWAPKRTITTPYRLIRGYFLGMGNATVGASINPYKTHIGEHVILDVSSIPANSEIPSGFYL